MTVSSNLRSGRLASANSPNRLVRKENTREVGGGQRIDSALELAFEDGMGMVGFPFRQAFANADDGDQAGGEGGLQAVIDRGVRFAKVLAAFGVTDNDGAAAGIGDHGHGNFAGIGAFGLPVGVLSGDGDFGAAGGVNGGDQRSVGRGDDNVARVAASDERVEGGKEGAGFRLGLEHLPVSSNDRPAHNFS